jgi:hypothetical protein
MLPTALGNKGLNLMFCGQDSSLSGISIDLHLSIVNLAFSVNVLEHIKPITNRLSSLQQKRFPHDKDRVLGRATETLAALVNRRDRHDSSVSHVVSGCWKDDQVA